MEILTEDDLKRLPLRNCWIHAVRWARFRLVCALLPEVLPCVDGLLLSASPLLGQSPAIAVYFSPRRLYRSRGQGTGCGEVHGPGASLAPTMLANDGSLDYTAVESGRPGGNGRDVRKPRPILRLVSTDAILEGRIHMESGLRRC